MELKSIPIFPSLWKPILLGGAPRRLVIVEVILSLSLIFLVGLSCSALLIVALFTAIVHPILVYFASRDALAPEVYLRSLGYRDFYPAAPTLRQRPRPVRPSVPTRR
jgi:type IV secretory pathway TrbD component